MQRLVKIAGGSFVAVLLVGCAHGGSPAPAADETSQSASAYPWHDGSTGGVYGIGVGWSVSLLSAEYVTATEIIHFSGPTYELVSIPATYEWIKDDSVGPETEPVMESQLVTTPATYKTVTETIVRKPAETVYDLVSPVYSEDGKFETPVRITETHNAAVVERRERRVTDTPERTVERLVPAEHRPGWRRVVKTPARTEEAKYVPVFKTESRIKQTKPWRFVVRGGYGKGSHTFDDYEDFKRFKASLKQSE